MSIQTNLGKAFEYACLQSLYNTLSGTQQVVVEQNSALEIARQKYENATPDMQNKMDLGADAATRVILRLEPQLTDVEIKFAAGAEIPESVLKTMEP